MCVLLMGLASGIEVEILHRGTREELKRIARPDAQKELKLKTILKT